MHQMRRSAHHRLPALLAASLVLTGLAPAIADASSSVSYVALGDSYTAGPLLPDLTGSPLGCLRSTRSYPVLTAAAIGPASFTDVSCAGATTADMTEPQSVLFGTNPPQVSALSAGTTLVTVGIGGNDIGFVSIVEHCTTLAWTDPFGSPCKDYYTSGGTDRLAQAINSTGPKVAAVLTKIHADAPNARVLLVGYPDILPNIGDGCFPGQPIAFGDVSYLRHSEKELNQMLAAQAAAHGAIFVNTYTPSIGHDVCQPAGIRWIEGEIPASAAAPWHPNALGEKAMAAAIEAAIG